MTEAERERAAIVAWLREWADKIGIQKGVVISYVAHRIERGDHLVKE